MLVIGSHLAEKELCRQDQVLLEELVMARGQSEQPMDPDRDSSELVPVTFAANLAEAEFYQTLLADADIEVHIDSEVEDKSPPPGKGIAILVPADLLDDASEVIMAREEMETHILAGPDGHDLDDNDDDDDLSSTHVDEESIVDGEDIFFRRDPFTEEDLF